MANPSPKNQPIPGRSSPQKTLRWSGTVQTVVRCWVERGGSFNANFRVFPPASRPLPSALADRLRRSCVDSSNRHEPGLPSESRCALPTGGSGHRRPRDFAGSRHTRSITGMWLGLTAIVLAASIGFTVLAIAVQRFPPPSGSRPLGVGSGLARFSKAAYRASNA